MVMDNPELYGSIGIGLATILAALVSGVVLWRNKSKEVVSESARWLVDKLREDAEQERAHGLKLEADLAEAKVVIAGLRNDVDTAMEMTADCERHRVEDRSIISMMQSEIEELRRRLDEVER